MSKPLLSIIIPVAPNRQSRLQAVLSRLNLNQAGFPDHTFEVIVADGGATDGTREVCELMSNHMQLKYIFLPIFKFINAGYPRNVMLRLCEGQVIGMIDIDHWPSENIVFGMLHPFINDADFRLLLTKGDATVALSREYLNGQVDVQKKFTPGQIINRGYVIDSCKSQYCQTNGEQYAQELNAPLLHHANFDKRILDVYKVTRIPEPGVNNTLWTWALARPDVVALNGYDELYCRQFAYCREDDDWRERLLSRGLRFFDGENRNFCAIHLWHPAAQRAQQANDLNKRRFADTCQPVKQVRRNEGFEWGKFLADSFTRINGTIRGVEATEDWIARNISDAPTYTNGWTSVDEYMEALEAYVK